MATAPARKHPSRKEKIPPLYNGDHLTQPEFHRRYEAMPENVKAELIGGIVYMTSPLRRPHGTYHVELSMVLALYKASTLGVEAADNATAILDELSEPQPDLALRILPEFGGQCHTDENDYWVGPPELVAQVSHSTISLDLRERKQDFEKAGVIEYLVLCLKEKELHWFELKSGRKLRPDARGIYRSRVFPGLWIDGPALLARNSSRLIEVVNTGLTSKEHAEFVKHLKAAHRKRS